MLVHVAGRDIQPALLVFNASMSCGKESSILRAFSVVLYSLIGNWGVCVHFECAVNHAYRASHVLLRKTGILIHKFALAYVFATPVYHHCSIMMILWLLCGHI